MITHEELLRAREVLLDRIVSFFAVQADVIGIILAGSIPAGAADAYSDIDLRVVATMEGQVRLRAGRLEWPSQWGDLLFNEWLDGSQHCVSHFRPFLKADVFYLSPGTFTPSPWLKLPTQVFLDRTGLVRQVLDASARLAFQPPVPGEVSRILSKALAAAHETVRRVRRDDLFFAQSLLEELREFTIRLDMWLVGRQPAAAEVLTTRQRISASVAAALDRSYVKADAEAIETAAVDLVGALMQRIPALHRSFHLERSLTTDMNAAALVITRQVA